MVFNVTFETAGNLAVAFQNEEALNCGFDSTIRIGDFDIYDGDYDITPSDEVQVIPIEGKQARHDITIQPIPSNFGHIAYNGAFLSVY